jgi:hypothetical protein
MKRIVRLVSKHISRNVTDISSRVTRKQPLDPPDPQRGTACPVNAQALND